MKEDVIVFCIGCGIGAIIQILKIVKEYSNECRLLDSMAVNDISVPDYTQACLKWCSHELGGYIPTVKFSRAKKPTGKDPEYPVGLYDFDNEIITLFINRHDSIRQFTNTIIHEYQHHIQKMNGVTFKKYSKYDYASNPYEYECLNVAAEHEFICAIESLKAIRNNKLAA